MDSIAFPPFDSTTLDSSNYLAMACIVGCLPWDICESIDHIHKFDDNRSFLSSAIPHAQTWYTLALCIYPVMPDHSGWWALQIEFDHLLTVFDMSQTLKRSISTNFWWTPWWRLVVVITRTRYACQMRINMISIDWMRGGERLFGW